MRLCSLLLIVLAQFTSFNDRSRAILEGNWQSCREDGEYGERVWEYVPHREVVFELHLGPYHDFGVFRGPTDSATSDDHDHGNLLAAHNYDALDVAHGGRTWQFTVDGRTYRLNVVLAGGSREDCESFVLRLEPGDADRLVP